jgi:hypothetical protein
MMSDGFNELLGTNFITFLDDAQQALAHNVAKRMIIIEEGF